MRSRHINRKKDALGYKLRRHTSQHRGNLVGRPWRAEVEPLNLGAAFCPHSSQLLGSLYALCSSVHFQARGQADHCAQNLSGMGPVGHILEETLVDLDLVERIGAQVAQAGIPYPEVVERNSYS